MTVTTTDAEAQEAQEVLNYLMVDSPLEDPYPSFSKLRELAPIVRHEGTGLVFVSRYDLCSELLRNDAFGNGPAGLALRADPRFEDSPYLKFLSQITLFVDPPEHTRLRSQVSRAFTPKMVAYLKEYTADLASGLLDKMAKKDVADAMEDYAMRIPVTVICEMLGVPATDHYLHHQWASAISAAIEPVLTDDLLAGADDAVKGMSEYFTELVAVRRSDPKEDLLSVIVSAEHEDGALDADELMSMAIQLLVAGTDTTLGSISLGVWTLLNEPEQAAKLRDNPELDAGAFEETLRMEPPVQLSFPRIAFHDAEIGGMELPAGSAVHVMVSGANRDPAMFPDPDRLDIERKGANRHLSFGKGVHFCLGAALGRVESVIAIPALIRRFPDATIEPDGAVLRPGGGLQVRSLDNLKLRLR